MRKNEYDLEQLAFRLMKSRGLQPKFSEDALKQLSEIQQPASLPPHCEDLRHLAWCSIDNDDSRDLDQLTYAQKEENGKFILWIAVADVDALVAKNSPIDKHAQINTTSVYTPAKIFPMIPEKLSTDLTSLNENEDRLALVIKIHIDSQGKIEEGTIFRSIVRNHAKLAYNAVAAWLDGKEAAPQKVSTVTNLEAALRTQHEAAQILKRLRHQLGALTLEPIEAEAKISPFHEIILELPSHNLAEQLIEHFMIAANNVMANRLREAKIPSLRRVVRIPKRWDRLVQIAAAYGESLPSKPNSKALDTFLIKRKNSDPGSFPDLSLTVIKLLGRGEYIVEGASDEPVGHFGLALREYIHSTAPNRRYPDLISQRQYKAFLSGSKSAYSLEELQHLAEHCTHQEDVVIKVERHLNKSAAAQLLIDQIGTEYKGIVTGASEKGTWVRIFAPPVEGKIVRGFKNLDIGDHITVQLINVDIPKGYIDFAMKKV